MIRQIQMQMQGQSMADPRSPLLRGTEMPTENDIFLGP
jgi:hypothetical protein